MYWINQCNVKIRCLVKIKKQVDFHGRFPYINKDQRQLPISEKKGTFTATYYKNVCENFVFQTKRVCFL